MLALTQFTDFVKEHSLFSPRQQILLAVSGGKDSVLMAHLFKRAGYNFGIAHCNFNLRATESQRDETFVKLLASALNVPFYVIHFDTKAYASEHQISTQMAARNLRYQWFETLRKEKDYDFIAVAQHQDDSMETVLLNLTRGTGISGLHGILPKRGHIIRPMLFLSRAEIDALVAENNIDYVEDSSNQTAKYARNKIRLNVIPQLREINPNLAQTFAQNIIRFAQTEEVLQQVVTQVRNQIQQEKNGIFYFKITAVKNLNPRALLFFELLKGFNFSYQVVAEILNSLYKQSGTFFYSPTHRITIDRDDLILSPISAHENFPVFLHLNDSIVSFHSQKIVVAYSYSASFENNPNKAFVDFDKLIFPLTIRFRLNGDKFMPLGMNSFKKLSDFLIDSKVPIPQKDTIPILINGNGEIIWVAGLRQDNRYKVTQTTKKVAIFELIIH